MWILVLVCAAICKIICIQMNWQEKTWLIISYMWLNKQVALPAIHGWALPFPKREFFGNDSVYYDIFMIKKMKEW